MLCIVTVHQTFSVHIVSRWWLSCLVVRASFATQWSWVQSPAAALSVSTGIGDLSSGGHTTSVCNQPPRPTQPPTLCGTRNEYRPKCGDALWLGVKAGWLIPLMDKRVGGR